MAALIVKQLKLNLKVRDENATRTKAVWINAHAQSGLERLAKAHSVTKRAAHRLNGTEKGSYLDIRPRMRFDRWVTGAVRERDGGQVQVCWEMLGRNQLFWVHLDNTEEVSERGSKAQNKRKRKRYSVVRTPGSKMCAATSNSRSSR